MNPEPPTFTNPAQQEQPSVKKSSQGIMCMWHGLTVGGLLRLLMLRPPFAWSYSARWASIVVLSVVNSLQNAVESLVYGRKIRRTKIEQDPIFILGHWRSGTTMLHNLMTLDPQLTFPNFYQCLYPGHFLLTEKVMAPLTAGLLPPTRPMDNIPTGWNEPQEEDVALALDCLISPYLMLAFNDQHEKYDRFFDPRDMTEKERTAWKKSFLKLLRKLTLLKGRRIVTKNPGHTYRVPILLEMFPNARFIYIYRDPYAVYQSTLHLRNTMLSENSLAPPRLENGSEPVLRHYEKCIRTYEETKSQIPAGNLHELRFEDLELDPLGEMAKTYRALGLPGWDLVEPAVTAQLATLKAYKKNVFRMDAETMRSLYARLKWVFDLYGYPGRMDDANAAKS